MLVVGFAMALVGWLTFMRVRRKNYDAGSLSRGWRRLLVAMTFSGWVACVSALGYAVFGLYPYVVNDTVTLRAVAGGAASGALLAGLAAHQEIGRASCRERLGQYVSISVVAVRLNKKNDKQQSSI